MFKSASTGVQCVLAVIKTETMKLLTSLEDTKQFSFQYKRLYSLSAPLWAKHRDFGNKNLRRSQQPSWLSFTWSRGTAYGTRATHSAACYPVTAW